MSYTAPLETRVGHIHLKVSDLDQSIAFYKDVLGFRLQQRFGRRAAFLSAGGYHHHIALNTWKTSGAAPPPSGHTGLFHVAFLYPTRPALARALTNVLASDVALTGAADHGVSEAVYFNDPDSNGIELYWDRPRQAWPRADDRSLDMFNRPLDLDNLLAEAA